MWQNLRPAQRAAANAATFLAAWLVWASPGNTARANDPLEPTTELGVTITSKEIFDAFHESVEFWPRVRKFILSDEFPVAERDDRAKAIAYIKGVQDQLHARLFSDDEKAAADLVRYVSWGLRREKFFRDLRGVFDDKRTLIELRHAWQTAYREAQREGHQVNVTAVVSIMKDHVEPLGLSSESQVKVMGLWQSIGECMVQMDQTEVGHIMNRADQSLDHSPNGELVREIVAAADWAQVIKTEKTLTQRKDFAAAWEELFPTRLAQTPKTGQ